MGGGGILGSIVGGIAGFMVGGPAGAAIGAGMGGTTGMQYDQQQAALKAQKQANAQQAKFQQESLAQQQAAQQQATQQAEKQAKVSEQTMNAATKKSPDVSSIMAAAEATQQGGLGSTMLTGPTGIDPNDLKLNKSTLLGA